MLNQILEDLIVSVEGAYAAIFVDGDGEFISQAGDTSVDMKLMGAWNEIQLDRIRDIAGHLGLGNVHAVMFSVEEGNELFVPVSDEYCLLLFLSAYANLADAMDKTRDAMHRLKREVE